MTISRFSSGRACGGLEGRPLRGQTHGLADKTVGHVFRLRDGKMARFDIQGA